MALLLRKSLFIHVPKTGGTFVRAACQSAGIVEGETGDFKIEDHYGISEIHRFHPELLTRFTFGFVRHPVTWMRSRWAWAMESGFAGKIASNREAARHWMADCWSDNFPEFVRRSLSNHPGIATKTQMGMLGYVHADKWQATPLTVTAIGRAEYLASDLIRILNQAGEDFDPAVIRATEPKNVAASGKYREMSAMPYDLAVEVMKTENELADEFGYSMRELHHATDYPSKPAIA